MQDLHNGYALVSEKVKMINEMLSEYQLQIIEDNSFSLGKNKKLISNLSNKRKHKLHYQNLKPYLNLGIQLKIIYRLL